MSVSSILGDDWLKNFTLFRCKPETFLEKRKLTREAVCFDILKDLYSDNIDPQCKVHLLLLLQENSSLLIQDNTLIEQTVGSLLNLYHLLQNRNDKRLLKSQILISITTILLGWEEEDDCVLKLTLSHKAFLLEIIYSGEDNLLISTACKCLEEIETFYPNILKPDLSSMLITCEKHMSPSFQSYVTLLSLVTKQAAVKTKAEDETQICDIKDQPSSESKELVAVSTPEEDVDYLHLVSYLLEQLPYMSHVSVYRVLKNLIPVVQHVQELSANTFRRFLPSLIISSDVLLFHLSFELLMTFKSELFSSQEEQKLLQQLVLSATNPSLSSSHRLMYLEWLKSFASQEGSLSLLPNSVLQLLLPNPYDGPITQEKKLYLLCQIIPLHIQENVAVEFLNESISGLKKCALLPNANKAAVSFFRILYMYFSCRKTDVICSAVYKLIVDISKTCPHLSTYALNFLTCVKKNLNEKIFYTKAMSNLVDHILSLPIKQLTINLSNYLAVLEIAAEEAPLVCKPKTLLKYLQVLLRDTQFNAKDGWNVGNDILSICRNFLKFHDVQLFYYELAEVLCLVTKNIADIDVKNRSKLYYSTLTSLSQTKTQTMFSLQSFESDRNKPLTTFVAGGGSNLKFAGSIHKLKNPVLHLQKVNRSTTFQDLELVNYDSSLSENDILKAYRRSLTQHETSVTISFILKHTQNVEEIFSTLYCIVITAHSTPPCKTSTIEIPVFQGKRQSNEEVVVSLQLTPKLPYPMKLEFKAEFTSTDCCTYSCDISPVAIEFDDLFLPLPVPQPINSIDSWKHQLFDLMWEEFLRNSSTAAEAKCFKSVFRPDISATELTATIENEWKPFIIEHSSACSIAIYIPPADHILMKVTIVNEKPFIHILVDDVSILPWYNMLLQKLNKK